RMDPRPGTALAHLSGPWTTSRDSGLTGTGALQRTSSRRPGRSVRSATGWPSVWPISSGSSPISPPATRRPRPTLRPAIPDGADPDRLSASRQARERVPAPIAQERRQAPEVGARLRLMPDPDDAAARLVDHPLERLGGEVRKMSRQLEARPRAAEDRRAEPARVRDLHDQEPARRQPVEHTTRDRHRIRDVLEDVEGRHHVEATRGERRGEDVADVYLVGETTRQRRRGLVHLDAGDPPAERARDRERAARAAPDVEIATGTDPRRAAPPDPPEHSPRPEPRRERYARVAERAVAEAVGERPPRGALTALRALQRHPRRR